MNINQDRKVVHIKAPQDEVIIKLNAELNKTYLWYGQKQQRDFYQSNQVLQDENAKKLGSSFFSRSQTKAGALYSNKGRDLCDTCKVDKTILTKLKASELPEAMQKMTPKEREAHVAKLSKRRAEIQKEIAKVSAERGKYVAAKRKEISGKTNDTLGAVINSAVGRQLQKSGFSVER